MEDCDKIIEFLYQHTGLTKEEIMRRVKKNLVSNMSAGAKKRMKEQAKAIEEKNEETK